MVSWCHFAWFLTWKPIPGMIEGFYGCNCWDTISIKVKVLGSHMGEWRCRCTPCSQHWIDVSGQLHGSCHFVLEKRVTWRLGVPHVQSRWFQGRNVADLSLHWNCDLWSIGPIVLALHWPIRIVFHCHYVGMKKNWAGQILWRRPCWGCLCYVILRLARFHHTYTFVIICDQSAVCYS